MKDEHKKTKKQSYVNELSWTMSYNVFIIDANFRTATLSFIRQKKYREWNEKTNNDRGKEMTEEAKFANQRVRAETNWDTLFFYKNRVYKTLRIWTEHLWCHLILELFFHPKHPYFATITSVLAPGMALVHTSLLASDIYRYMPGKTQEYGN